MTTIKPSTTVIGPHLIRLGMALILSGVMLQYCLAQTSPRSSTAKDPSPQPGKQVEQGEGDSAKELSYLFYLPEGYELDKDKDWPLVLFLHGRGESDGPLQKVAKWGPPKLAANGDRLPFILVSPQCPRSGSWRDETRQRQLDQLLRKVTATYRVDPSRIYLTGLSMGGYGSWTLAANHPDRFAAVIPICGGGNPKDASLLTHIPIWVFHGDQDKSVPLSRSVEMVKAIQEAGGMNVRFTTLEHVGHNSWSSAYALPELFQWMLKRTNNKNNE